MRAAFLVAALLAAPAAAQISGVPEPFHGIGTSFSSNPFDNSPATANPAAGPSTSIVGGSVPSQAGGRCPDGRYASTSGNGYACDGRGSAPAATPRR